MRIIRFSFVVALAVAAKLIVPVQASTGPIPLNCNRACLENVIDQYLRAQLPGAVYQAFGDGPINILIAGCGTGMHAIQRAEQFKNADVLAIDLSLSSLSSESTRWINSSRRPPTRWRLPHAQRWRSWNRWRASASIPTAWTQTPAARY